jgi:hypothetical protein
MSMPNFIHKAAGSLPSGAFWSFGLYSMGAVSEATAEATWGGAVATFFGTTAVAALWRTDMVFTASSTSTASATWKQSTITRTTHSVPGTATSQQLPDSSAAIVTLRSVNATKSAHGRWYLPPLAETALAMGPGPHLSAGTNTALSAGISALFTALSTGGLTPVILTRRPTVSGLPAYSTQAITHRDIPNILGVQTRRGDKIVPTRTTA